MNGDAGTRIFKIQYSNIGLREDIEENNSSTDYANFQLWLYEGSNIIEIHFGESLITNFSTDFQGNTGPFISLIPEFYIMDEEGEGGPISEFFSLSGAQMSPNLEYEYSMNYINGMPENGRVYRFTPQDLSTSEVYNNSAVVQILTNPVKEVLKYSCQENIKSIYIYNDFGQKLQTIINPSNSLIMDDLPTGLYNVVFELESKQKISKKILKKYIL